MLIMTCTWNASSSTVDEDTEVLTEFNNALIDTIVVHGKNVIT
jgi:hypothetical protein